MKKKVIISLIILALLAGLVFAFIAGRKERAAEAEREKPIKAPSRVEAAGDENVVTLDQPTRQRSGVVLAPLEAITHRPEIPAYGTVVDVQELIDLRNSSETTRAGVVRAQAALGIARREFERNKNLYANRQSVSDKDLQVAEGAFRTEEANAAAAQASLNAAVATARQHWGGVIAEWLARDAPEFDRLRQQQELLVQVTLPAGRADLAPPPTAAVRALDGALVAAKFVSAAPRTDPKIQGASFFYTTAAAGNHLAVGMNVTALLPTGEPAPGTLVPASAVVWLQGKAWAYAQRDQDRFARREVSTEQPVPDGWFQPAGFSQGEPFVVAGAQVLLSEEFRAQIEVGEDKK